MLLNILTSYVIQIKNNNIYIYIYMYTYNKYQELFKRKLLNDRETNYCEAI